jgi:hypothetical protein
VQRGAIKTGRPQPFTLLLPPPWTSKWLPWRTFLWALAQLRDAVAFEVPAAAPRLALLHSLPISFPNQSSIDDAAALANLRDDRLVVGAACAASCPQFTPPGFRNCDL